MTRDENEAVVLRLYDELYNRGHLFLIPTLVAPGFIDHAASDALVSELDGLQQVVARLRIIAPGIRYIVEDLIVQDDRVAVRVSCGGTPGGPVGSALSSRGVMPAHIAIMRLVAGKVVERWIAYLDHL